MKFDDILQEVGEFGPYQKRVFYLMSLPAIICGLQVMSVLFVYDIPAYRCALPNYTRDTYEIQNEAHAHFINYTIPQGDDINDDVYSGCEIYDVQHTKANTSVFASSNATRSKKQCDRHVFEKTHMEETVITHFDLVCGGEIMRSHSNSLAFFGSFLGSMGMGIIADLFGRKKAIILALIIEIGYGLITYLSQSFYVIMVARIIAGIATHALFAIPATTGIELVGPNMRSFTGTAIAWYWWVGIMLVLPIAYLLRQWRDIQLAITILSVPLLGLWWLVPESPRWLLDKERYSEVEVILQKICKSNKCKLPAGSITPDTNEQEPELKIWSMFTNKVLIIRTFIIFFNWLAVNLFYYGITLNMSNLEGDPYINYLYGALVEFLSYVFCIIAIPRSGRRRLHFTCITIGGLATLAVIPVALTGGNAWIITILAQIGKFCSCTCYMVLYIMSAELFPTVLRNSGIGLCSLFESLGGISSPYIADLGLQVPGPLGKSLSMVVFGAISLTAGALSLLLPETLHRKLPETVQDAIDFDKQKKNHPKKNGYEMAPVL